MFPLSKKEAGYSDQTDWPGQRASQPALQQPQGYFAYEYGRQPADDWTGVESSKSGLSLKDIIERLNQKDPKITNINFANKTLSFQDGSELSFGDAAKQVMELDKSGSAESEEQESNPDAGQGFYDGDKGFDMGKRPQSDQFTWPSDTWMPRGTEEMDAEYWDNIAASLAQPTLSKISKYETAVPRSEAKFRVVIFDGRGVQYFAKQEDASKFYEHALKTELDPCEPEPFVYKKALSKKELSKQANPSTRYWIAPDGVEYDAGTHHGAWIKTNKDILNKWNINTSTIAYSWEDMLNKGWVRISNEPAGSGFQIQVRDINNIPSFVDDFVAKNYQQGDTIELGDQNGQWAKITDPFPSLQKAVNKALRNPVNASLHKQSKQLSLEPNQIYTLKSDLIVYPSEVGEEKQTLMKGTKVRYLGSHGRYFAAIGEVDGKEYYRVRPNALKEAVKQLKKADLIEYSNEATRDANQYIITHGDILHVVVDLAKSATSEQILSSFLKDSLASMFNEFGIDPASIRWNELAYVYYTSVKAGEDEQRRFQGQEPLKEFNIENLPTLDKKKKLDELLDQLSAETNPQKQEQIKQHIERIKRASLKQANSVEEVGGIKIYINPTWEQAKALLNKTRYVEIRGIVEPNSGDLFIWDSHDLTHEDVARNLGIDVDVYGDETPEHADYLSVMGDQSGLLYMFELQQKVRKALSRRKKKADLSGSTINDILKLIHQDGGTTYNLTKGNMAGADAYAVATHPERSKILEYPLDFEELERYVVENQDLLSDPMNSFGAWVNDGKVYLDIVATVSHRDQAINLGKEHNQIAIFDLKNFKEIPTGGTGQPITSKKEYWTKAICPLCGELKSTDKTPKEREHGWECADCTGKRVTKSAAESLLTQEQQNEIAAKYNCPAMNIALNNYAEAVKRGHDKTRSLEYAIESVSNIDKISEQDLVEAINTYLQGLV